MRERNRIGNFWFICSMPKLQWITVTGTLLYYLFCIVIIIIRSTEKLASTFIEDIIFASVHGIDYFFRDPEFLRQKRENAKTRNSYGVSGDFSGLGMYNPYYLMKVFLIIEVI